MEQVEYGPEVARMLAAKIRKLRMSAAELSSFGEEEPALAAECGVEIAALEARTILAGFSAERVVAAAEQAERQNRPFAVYEADMRAMNRLEGVVALASSRISQRYMALEGAESNVSKLGTAINVVSGLAGLVRTFL